MVMSCKYQINCCMFSTVCSLLVTRSNRENGKKEAGEIEGFYITDKLISINRQSDGQEL